MNVKEFAEKEGFDTVVKIDKDIFPNAYAMYNKDEKDMIQDPVIIVVTENGIRYANKEELEKIFS